MTNNFTIHPYKGLGVLEFGMSPPVVASLIGKPDDIELDDNDGELREFRRESGFQTIFSKQGASLIEMGFSSNIIELNFSGIEIFSEPEEDVIDKIVKIDGRPYFAYGFLVFLNIGISLSGFQHRDDSAKGVTIFAKGRWDAMREDLKLWRG